LLEKCKAVAPLKEKFIIFIYLIVIDNCKNPTSIMKYRMTTLFLIVIPISINIAAQARVENIEDSIKKYIDFDYMDYDYKYLDENYNIEMTSSDFNEALAKSNIKPRKLDTYKDSMYIVVWAEFGHGQQMRIAHLRLTMSWKRVGYYLWLSELETEKIGEFYKFNHPYKLYNFAYNEQNEWDQKMKDLIDDLRKRVYQETNEESVFELETKDFLSYALKANPSRQESFMQTRRKRLEDFHRSESTE
jgi:hypothetical protein